MSQLPRPNGPKSAGGAKAHGRFLLANVGMWLVMTAILVLLPDQLDRWMDLAIGSWQVNGLATLSAGTPLGTEAGYEVVG